ncbi:MULTISPECIES: hypothetical protein [Oceanospirillaceae]|uniref:Uncharacterized protein n=1 Tax=Oceanobacter antarcticus TaxID=3133425 RepID=A0ABW8NHL5_9GAMM
MQRKDTSFSHSSTPHWTAATCALRGLPDDLDSVSPTFDLTRQACKSAS